MNENIGSKVPFTVESITKCMYPRCQVQNSSRCVNEKMEKLDKEIGSADKAPKPQEVPGVYCSTGAAICKDLNPSQMCICGSYAIWHEYKLMSGKPIYYFCKNGRAQ